MPDQNSRPPSPAADPAASSKPGDAGAAGCDLTIDETLVLLIEECGEVIQAATKCLRFGYERDWPDYGINHKVLAKEIGDLLGAVDALPLDRGLISTFRKAKMAKARRAKMDIGRL